MKLTRRRFLEATLLGAGAAVAGLGLANLDLGPFNTKKVEAEQAPAEWTLQVTNLASKTATYTIGELLAMPATTVDAVLCCDDFQVAAGSWRGVSLSYLLQEVGLDPMVESISFEAEDGYSVTLQLPEALDPNVIVAYGIDDASFSNALRLVVPGDDGSSWINTIDSISMAANPSDVGQERSSLPTRAN